MTTILGISAFYHDSAAALIRDGRIVAAAQEERFTRIKHDHRFPQHAIEYCLDRGWACGPSDLDYWSASTTSRSSSSSASWRRTCRLRAARLPLLPAWRCRSGSSRSSTHATGASARAWAGRYEGPNRLRRTPRVARGQRLLPFARSRRPPSSRSTASASGRRRSFGVGHRESAIRDAGGAALPPLARAALLRVHLLHRLSR